jgi:hypothetical protein
MIRSIAWQCVHCVSYHLEIGDDWLAVRDFNSFTVIPFDKIAGLLESPLVDDGKIGGYRFCYYSEDGRAVDFSTQIIGWAEVIQTIHSAAASRVPDLGQLEAFRIMRTVELPPEAAALTAPGKNSPAAWRAGHIARWYDYWIGWLLALMLSFWPGYFFTRMLRGLGFDDPWLGLLFMISLGFIGQILSTTIARLLRKWRSRRRAANFHSDHGRN